jgi:hypothetical protein
VPIATDTWTRLCGAQRELGLFRSARPLRAPMGGGGWGYYRGHRGIGAPKVSKASTGTEGSIDLAIGTNQVRVQIGLDEAAAPIPAWNRRSGMQS